MRKTLGATVGAMLLLALAVAPAARPVAARADTPPNIVLFLTDDQRWDELENMPNVHSLLIDEGVQYTNMSEPNSLCCPSRTTILTGQYSNHNGVWNNAAPNGGFKAFLPHEAQTLPVWLHAAGYRTALIGKYLNQYAVNAAKSPTNPTGLQARPGWDYWTSFINSGQQTGGEPPAYYDYHLDLGATPTAPGTLTAFGDPSAPTPACDVYGTCYSTTVFGQEATSFIDSSTSSPFFLYFAPFAPHSPSTPAPPDVNALPTCAGGQTPPGCYQPETLAGPGHCPPQDGLPPFCSENVGRAGANEVSWVNALPHAGTGFNTTERLLQERTLLEADRQIGAIVDDITARGQLSNTVFIFTSDNSLSGGSHNWSVKESAWQEAGHDPFVIRYDPVTGPEAGTVDDHVILNADIAPTLLDLAGATAPGSYAFDGQVIPTFNPSFSRTAYPLEHLANGANPPTYCGVRTTPDFDLSGVTGAWTYVRYQNLPGKGYPPYEEELYDLSADPYEMTNLAGVPADASTLEVLKAQARALCAPPPPGYTWPGGSVSRVRQIGTATTTSTSSPTQLSVTVGAGGVPAGDTIVIGVSAIGTPTVSAQDGAGNAYHLDVSRPYAGAGPCTSAILSSRLTSPLAAGQTITVKLGKKAVVWGFGADEWTGLTGLDRTGGADSAGTRSKAPSVATGAATSQAGEAVVAVTCTTGNPVLSAGASYAPSAMLKMAGAANKRGLGIEFKSAAAAGVQTAAFKASTAQNWSAVVATYP
jgi:arylsulfatase A-like enzyme